MTFDKERARAWIAGPEMGTHKACKYLLAACDRIDELEKACDSVCESNAEWLKGSERQQVKLAKALGERDELKAELALTDRRSMQFHGEAIRFKALYEAAVEELEKSVRRHAEAVLMRERAECDAAELMRLLDRLLNKVNAVTAPWRHQDGFNSAVLDDLANRQIEVEAGRAAVKKARSGE
jgi:hypothetical protein